jgi:dTDP-4-dehydrorhamnose reductase
MAKWLGEQAILASGYRYLILRTGWLHSPCRHNLLKTMLRVGIGCSSLSVVSNQIGSLTSAIMLAEATLVAIRQTLANPALSGLYDVAAAGAVSWYDYINFIFKEACALEVVGRIPSLIPITSGHYASLVPRSWNLQLDTHLFSKIFGIHFSSWKME